MERDNKNKKKKKEKPRETGSIARLKPLQVACAQCRRRKARCDGGRPACASCHSKKEDCVYETQEGESRTAALRRENEALQNRVAHLEETQSEHYAKTSSFGRPYQVPEIETGSTTTYTSPDSGASPASAGTAGSQSALILQAMSGATDNTASMLLAKLRTGHSWAELVDDIHQSSYVSKDQPTLSRTITRTATLSSHPFQESDQIMSDGVDLDLPERRLSSLQLSIGENLSRTSHLVWKRDFHSTARQINLSANFTATASSNHESQEIPVQIWAIVPLIDHTAQDCFETVFKDARAAIESGTPVQDFYGSHVWLEALHNECVYQSAPRLSQLVANLIRRTQSQAGYDRITEYGIMWLYWTHFRWILHASPQTYHDMPVLLRPTPPQLFVMHPRMLDFILSPGLRNYLLDTGKYTPALLADAVKNVVCNWSGTLEEATSGGQGTGDIHLSARFKAHISRPEAWTVDIGAFLAFSGD